MIARLKAFIFNRIILSCKNILTYCYGMQMNLLPSVWLIFLIHFWYARTRFYLFEVCSLEKTI
jgi:hypothetical protein